jgi:hypothetical protein
MRSSDNSLDHFRNARARPVTAMYATRLLTEIYHLVEPSEQHTLCGLRVSRLTLARKTTTLHLVNEVASNVTICKHCERIKNQEGSRPE